MIYNVSTTDQLALHLSMNQTELVEMQYKSMYDAGMFQLLAIYFDLVLPQFNLSFWRNTRGSKDVTYSTNHWYDNECAFWVSWNLQQVSNEIYSHFNKLARA